MKPEELVSKELSTWRERPTRPVSPMWGARVPVLGLPEVCRGLVDERVPLDQVSGSVSFSSQVMESRNKLHSENKKTAAKQEPVPDMEDSPPVSDSDVSLGDFGSKRDWSECNLFPVCLGLSVLGQDPELVTSTVCSGSPPRLCATGSC